MHLSVKPYQSSWEHLGDEFRRLDLLIQRELLRQGVRQSSNPLDPFRGLCISEEEIKRLLAGARGNEHPGCEDHSKQREIDTCVAALGQVDDLIRRRLPRDGDSGSPLPLVRLTQLLGLTEIERGCIVICLAPELDRKYEKLYAYLQDDVTRRKPSVDLVLSLLCGTQKQKVEARSAFEPHGSLLKWRLLSVTDVGPDGPTPLLSRVLKLDDRIVSYLLDARHIDARLGSMTRLVLPDEELGPASLAAEVRSRLRKVIGTHARMSGAARSSFVVHFHGPRGSGKLAEAGAICREMRLPMLVADAERMVLAGPAFEELGHLLGREGVLQPAPLCVENFDYLVTEDAASQMRLKALLEAIQAYSGLTFLLGCRAWNPHGLVKEEAFISVGFNIPDSKGRQRLWEIELSRENQVAAPVDCGALASQFRFTPGQIHDALLTARSLSRWEAGDGRLTQEHIYTACRAQSNQSLNRVARRIDPKVAWDDLVLPNDQMAQLHDICDQAKHRHIVFGEWGFDRRLSLGKGLNVIFSGPPGTGKTMAAEVIARDLRVGLYKIDLSQVVSKYIGETEKNLDRIFHEAQTSDAILFFDEADALFGKRSEVKDAHDRYANIEIGYLLQKMEEYEGVAILATNLRQNMDEAFVRRMQFIVEFPFPDEGYRRRIWQVTFPREAPIGEDVDFDVLARDVRLAGGNIKNIALAAAFYAANNGKVIQMSHLILGSRREHQKLGRTWVGTP